MRKEMSVDRIDQPDDSPEMLPLLTPGVFLRTEFMEPRGFTAYRMAKDIGVDQGRIEGILDGRRAITLDTVMRLSRYFGTSPEMWLNLQSQCDMRRAEREAGSGSAYDHIALHPGMATGHARG
jgi:addiction module HigA family antidote